MAVKIRTQTLYGEERELYVRVNNFEQLTNHDEAGPDRVLIRGYISKEAFDERRAFVWELALDVTIDVSLPAWPQVYDALKAHDPTLAIGPPPPPPDPLPEDSGELKQMAKQHAGSVDDLQAAHAAAEARHAANVAAHEAEMASAVKLRNALRKAKDV